MKKEAIISNLQCPHCNKFLEATLTTSDSSKPEPWWASTIQVAVIFLCMCLLVMVCFLTIGCKSTPSSFDVCRIDKIDTNYSSQLQADTSLTITKQDSDSVQSKPISVSPVHQMLNEWQERQSNCGKIEQADALCPLCLSYGDSCYGHEGHARCTPDGNRLRCECFLNCKQYHSFSIIRYIKP